MRIGLLTVRNVASKPIRLAQYINMAMQPHGDVRHLGAAAAARATRGGRLRLAIGKKLRGGRHTLSLERKYALEATADFNREPVDLVLGIFTSAIIPYFDVPANVPIVHVSDSTQGNIYEVEEGYERVDDRTYQKRVQLERDALQRADLMLYPSDWAARSAIDDMGVDPDRVHVVEFGGAAEDGLNPPNRPEPTGDGPIEMLFLGIALERKGIDIALGALERLRGNGRKVRLSTIGGRLPRSMQVDGVEELGWLDLGRDDHLETFENAMSRATCLIHPARAECYGHALVEACARGVPVVCTRAGGMPTIVHDGENGLLIDAPPTVDDACAAVLKIAEDPELARRLSEGARTAWEQRLSWERWAQRLMELAQPLTERTATASRA